MKNKIEKRPDNIDTSVFGSDEILRVSPKNTIPQNPMPQDIAYQIVHDEVPNTPIVQALVLLDQAKHVCLEEWQHYSVGKHVVEPKANPPTNQTLSYPQLIKWYGKNLPTIGNWK